MELLIDVPQSFKKRHPAKYTDALFPVFIRMLRGRRRILDPFGGTGKIFELRHWYPNAQIEAVEIEPEWAALNKRTTLGNALALPAACGMCVSCLLNLSACIAVTAI